MNTKHIHTSIDHVDDLKDILNVISNQSIVSFDLETEGLIWWGDNKIVGIGLGYYDKLNTLYTYYLPLLHRKKLSSKNLSQENLNYKETLELLSKVMSNSSIYKVGANIKFDAHFIEAAGYKLQPLHDVQVMARLLRTDYITVGLDKLVEKEFDSKHEEWQELQAWGRKAKVSITQKEVEEYAFAKAPIDIVSRYCGKDVYWTLRLFLKYVKELNHPKNKPLLNLYKFVEKPLIEAVKVMETNGIRLDIGYLQSVSPLLEEEIRNLEQKIYDKAGKVFNVNSNLALKELFKSIGLKPEFRRRKKLDGTREETPSYDGTTLEHAQDSFPIVKDILEYRDRVKILGTYVKPLLAAGEFTHPSIKAEAARTGRMSMGIFNTLKRVDKDDEKDSYTIRKAIIPLGDDCQLVSIDYGGIEYRLLAHFSNEPALVKLFNEGGDFHQYIADLLGVKRSVGKTFNFAKLYGASAASLSAKLKISLAKVKKIIAEYEIKIPNLPEFSSKVTVYCIQHGGIRNPFGRWRTIPKSLAYIATNSLIQSTAADILKIAINRAHKFLVDKQSKLLFPVHDELVINWHKCDGDIITPIIQRMEGFVLDNKPMFRVPITVSVGVCNGSWANKKEVGFKEMLEIFCTGIERRYDSNVPLLPWQKACVDEREVDSLWVHKDTSF